MIPKDEESPIKDKKNYKSNDRRKYEHIDKDSTLSDSYSAEVRVKIKYPCFIRWANQL